MRAYDKTGYKYKVRGQQDPPGAGEPVPESNFPDRRTDAQKDWQYRSARRTSAAKANKTNS